jgi:hypothetical protein
MEYAGRHARPTGAVRETLSCSRWLMQALYDPIKIESLGRPLTAVVEDDNPRSDEFCASTDDPGAFDFFDNDREGKSIVQGHGNQ